MLVLFSIVPVVVENGDAGEGLLEVTATIGVDGGDGVVVDQKLIVVGLIPDVEWCDLRRLGDRTDDLGSSSVDSGDGCF